MRTPKIYPSPGATNRRKATVKMRRKRPLRILPLIQALILGTYMYKSFNASLINAILINATNTI